MSPFAAGIVLLLLLAASYSRRSTWIALGSMAMSMAVLFGCLFLASNHERSRVRAGLALVASKLTAVVDKQTAEGLLASLEKIEAASPCAAGEPGCGRETASAPLPAEQEPMQAAATAAGWFDRKPDPKATSQSPVTWDLDAREVQLPVTSPWGFSISGTNVSDAALDQVRAFLKPDSTNREMPLALSVEDDRLGDGGGIPAKARFSLFSAAPDEGAPGEPGGAILTFRYVQAGQRKTSILYLTPAMISSLASR